MTESFHKWIERAKDFAGVIMPVVLGVGSWACLELVSHGMRLSVLERGEVETRRQFDRIDNTLIRIEEKLDRISK